MTVVISVIITLAVVSAIALVCGNLGKEDEFTEVVAYPMSIITFIPRVLLYICLGGRICWNKNYQKKNKLCYMGPKRYKELKEKGMVKHFIIQKVK